MPPSDPNRNALLAKIHVAKAQLGLDDETYRAMVVRIVGKTSSKDASTMALVALVGEMKAKGWQDQTGFRASRRPDIRKIYALWGELKRLGALDSPTKKALRAFCARMARTGDAVTDPEFLTPEQAKTVIEALKAWIEREGA